MRTLIIILALFFSGCSMVFDEDIAPVQRTYLKKAIVCDGKTSTYQIIEKEDQDIPGFFDGEGSGQIKVEYEYKKGVVARRTITLIRKEDSEGRFFFKVDFDRFTFPGSDCNDLKRKPTYLNGNGR